MIFIGEVVGLGGRCGRPAAALPRRRATAFEDGRLTADATGDRRAEGAVALYEGGDYRAGARPRARGASRRAPKDARAAARSRGSASTELDLDDAVELPASRPCARRAGQRGRLARPRRRASLRATALRTRGRVPAGDRAAAGRHRRARRPRPTRRYAAGAGGEAIAQLEQARRARARERGGAARARRRLPRDGQDREALAAAEAAAAAGSRTTCSRRSTSPSSTSSSAGPRAPSRRTAGCGAIDDDPEHEVYAYHGMIQAEMTRDRWRRALDLAIDATRVDRSGGRRTSSPTSSPRSSARPTARPPPALKSTRRSRPRRLSTADCTRRKTLSSEVATPPKTSQESPVDEVPVLRRVRLPQAPEAEPRRLPRVQLPLPAAGPRAARAAARRGQLRGPERRHRARRRARRSPTRSRTRSGSPTRRRRPGNREGALYGTAAIGEQPLVVAVMDFAFIGGSMGGGVGEAITRAAELALEKRLPLLVIASSGGARMQEGCVSLMQMAKTSQAVAPPARGGHPVHLAARRPHLRRRQRLVRDSRRPARLRAGQLHRLRRPEGDRADDPPEAPGRIPDRGVPARPRPARPRRAAREPAQHAAQDPRHARERGTARRRPSGH